MLIRQAVVFAGGRGSRLMPYTKDKPKPLVKVNNQPFFDYILYELKKSNINKVLFLTGYKGQSLKSYYKNNSDFNFKFSHLSPKAKPGKRLLNSLKLLDNYFLLIYSDNYWKINISKIIQNLKQKKMKNSMTVFKNINGTGEYGFKNNILYNKEKIIINYDKTKKNKLLNGLDIGFFILNKRDIVNLNINKYNKFEKIINKLIKEEKITAFTTQSQYYYMTNKKSLKNFENLVLTKKIKFISNAR